MRTKKYTVIFSGLLTLISIVCFAVFHFRLYHLINIYGDGSNFLKGLREFLIVSSSGLFTSSCVTLVISLREYWDVKDATLRDILQCLTQINVRYQKVQFFTSKIPEKIVIPYLIAKHNCEKSYDSEIIEFMRENNIEFDDPHREKVSEEKEKVYKYLWENEQNDIKESCNSELERKKYLEKKWKKIEKEYLEGAKKLVESLYIFNDITVFQIQEVFDKLCLFNKKKQDDLSCSFALIENDIIAIKRCLDFKNHKDSFLQLCYTLDLFNFTAIEYSESRDAAYLLSAFLVDTAKSKIYKILNQRNRKKEVIDKHNYDIRFFSHIEYEQTIVWEKLENINFL